MKPDLFEQVAWGLVLVMLAVGAVGSIVDHETLLGLACLALLLAHVRRPPSRRRRR